MLEDLKGDSKLDLPFILSDGTYSPDLGLIFQPLVQINIVQTLTIITRQMNANALTPGDYDGDKKTDLVVTLFQLLQNGPGFITRKWGRETFLRQIRTELARSHRDIMYSGDS